MPSVSTELLVIGGGSTGLGIAWDACLRGLKVVLVEQNDLGQGTSGRYHGILHSGSRYVISDPPSARECATENLILRRIVPHAIEDTSGFFVALPDGSIEYPDRWFVACQNTGVQAQEISVSQALQLEPALNPHITRAFRVNDASLDSFDLLHALASALQRNGGQVWLRHRVERLILSEDTVVAAEVVSLETGEVLRIGADLIVNASGPWTPKIAAMADISIPMALSKGTMLAMTSRTVNTIINRCRPPDDGDIIVPVGSVIVIGTTDMEVDKAEDLSIEPWEIDFLLSQGRLLVPGLSTQRPLRAWAGIRPLYRPTFAHDDKTRELPRSHLILDHHKKDGVNGLISVFGGKLTTYRAMAEEAVDLVCEKLSMEGDCLTTETSIEPTKKDYHRLPDRLSALSDVESGNFEIVCECEMVTRSMLEDALRSSSTVDLDDYRRDFRLGMGPCQAGFCGFRAAAIAHEIALSPPHDGGLNDFLQARWRGIQPLAWGDTLRQMELTRRIYVDLLGVHLSAEKGE